MAAPKTVATYDLNGSAREFDFSFDYLSRGFVKVTIIGTERRTLTVGTDYTFVSNNRIRTNLIYGPPDWTQIEIRRETSTTERLVDFQDASILRADDLNLSDLQVLHVAEEAREASTETLGVNNFGHLDARGRRIVNVADPVADRDVVNYRWYMAQVNGTNADRVAAQAARDKAREWATKVGSAVEGTEFSARHYANASASSATASASSASASDTHRANAALAEAKAKEWASKDTPVEGSLKSSKSYAADSLGSASAAASSASASNASAGSAAASASTAAGHSTKASQWADNAKDVPVEAGRFSARHWAAKSEEWALEAGAVPVAVQQVAAAVRTMYQSMIGTPIPWPSASIPAGYVALDGGAVPSNCPILAARYPTGFLPDLRDHFIRGQPVSGRALLSVEADGNKSHTHTGTGTAASGGEHTHSVTGTADSAGAHTHVLTVNNSADNTSVQRIATTNQRAATSKVNTTTSSAGAHTHTVSGTAASGGNHTHAVTVDVAASGDAQARPKNVTFLYICMTDLAIPALPTIGS